MKSCWKKRGNKEDLLNFESVCTGCYIRTQIRFSISQGKENRTVKWDKGLFIHGKTWGVWKEPRTKGLAVQNAPLKEIQLELNRFFLQFKAPTSKLMNTFAKSALFVLGLSRWFKHGGNSESKSAQHCVAALLLFLGRISLCAGCWGSDVISSFWGSPKINLQISW